MPSPEDRVSAALDAFEKNHPGATLSQTCERFLYYISYAANGMSDAGLTPYGSAKLAQDASGTLNSGSPPAGTVAWFDIGSPYGDGRYSLGNGVVVGPTDRKVSVLRDWGADVKSHTIASYQATGAKYLGWTTRNGANPMPSVTSAAADTITVFPTVQEDTMAPRLYQQSSTGFVAAIDVATGFFWGIPSPAYLALLRAKKVVIDEDPVPLADNEWAWLTVELKSGLRAFPALPEFPSAGTLDLTVADGKVTGTVTAQ